MFVGESVHHSVGSSRFEFLARFLNIQMYIQIRSLLVLRSGELWEFLSCGNPGQRGIWFGHKIDGFSHWETHEIAFKLHSVSDYNCLLSLSLTYLLSIATPLPEALSLSPSWPLPLLYHDANFLLAIILFNVS